MDHEKFEHNGEVLYIINLDMTDKRTASVDEAVTTALVGSGRFTSDQFEVLSPYVAVDAYTRALMYTDHFVRKHGGDFMVVSASEMLISVAGPDKISRTRAIRLIRIRGEVVHAARAKVEAQEKSLEEAKAEVLH